MPGRKFNSDAHRYGFNGKENDNETVSTGEGTQDYGMRIYNPSLGRFLSVDPITAKYPMLTPYQFASNRPIDGIDQDGLEYLQTEDKRIQSQCQNEDGTYEVTLDEKHKLEGITKETIGGKDYFNLGKDMYYGKNGWSNRSGFFGKNKMATRHLEPKDDMYSVNDFKSIAWPKMTGTEMNAAEARALAKGCVGITDCFLSASAIETTKENGGYSTLGLAQAQKKQLELANPDAKYIIYSVRFYSADPVKYKPDGSGYINMKEWNENERRGELYFNYDFGYLNESSGLWWDANHADIPTGSMEIYQKTLFRYSIPKGSYNRQIFVVGQSFK